MLYYSEERFIPTNNNIMVIENIDGAYFYVHRSLYDQAVILDDEFGDKKEALYSLLDIDTTDVPSCIEFFELRAPKPLSILGCFLSLVRDYALLPDEDIKTLCGVIHQISIIDLRKFVKLPKEVRASTSFSLSIKEEYQLAWDRFFQECIPYDEEMFLSGAKAYFKYIQEQYGVFVGTSVTIPNNAFGMQAQPMVEKATEPEEGIDIPFDWDSFEDEIDEEDEEENEEEEENKNEVTEEPEPEEEEEPADDGRSFLLAMAKKKKEEV